ncbi:MAG TPA: hypothetical protein VJW94_03650 [Candidatus Acidoferrum sp.]|nr:hypothetical protein [Candidatus Acidoferrum sp.]
MKFPIPVVCPYCGREFSSIGYGKKRISAAHCPGCGKTIPILAPLSISVVADRLLFRSRAEVDGGDPTVSIVCSAVAVEAALTHIFIKWKKIDNKVLREPNATQREEWEKEYRTGAKKVRKPSGFEKSANFVSKYLTGKDFDACVNAYAKNKAASELRASHINESLFRKRNRIMHWGKVNYKRDDALSAFAAARDTISILKVMDRKRSEAMELKNLLHEREI